MKRRSPHKLQTFAASGLFVAIVTILATVASPGQANKAGQMTTFGPMGTVNPSFLPAAIYYSGGTQPAFVTAADVNGDGKLDLLVANSYYSNSIGVLLGNGDGTFNPAVTYGSGGGFPTGIVPIDINGDGKLDLVVFNETACYACSGEGSVAVLLGRGDGTFGPATTYDSGGAGYGVIGPTPMAVLDVNHDGKLDVVVANCTLGGGNCGDEDGEVGVLLGNGDGTFRPVATYDTGFYPGGNGLAVGDLNGDGNPDLIVTSACSTNPCPLGSIGVLLGNRDGTFQPSVKYPLAGYSALGIAVADLNDDGKLDVVVGGCLSDTCLGEEGAVTVLLGKGDGTFQAAVAYGTGGGFADGIALADVNRDGILDVIVINFDGSVAVLPGKGDGTLLPAVTFASGTAGAYSVSVADVNDDGWPDVLVTGNSDIVSVLINNTAVVIQTTTTLASALNPSNYGQSVTFTAAVSSAKGTPTGTVIFYNGSNVLGSVMLADGGASFSISSLSAGTHSITAAYQRSGNFAPSTAVLKQVVNGNGPFPTKTKLATSGSPSSAGQSVTFTAAVTSANGATPNGDLVTFYDGSVELGTGITAVGVATFTTSSLTPGKHTIKATYSGGGRFEASTGTIAQVVGKYTTTTTLAGNPNPAAYGQPVTYTATVTSTGPTTPTGHVKFTSLGLAPLIGGVATYTKKLVLAGTHLITAEYEGDDVSAPSTSAVLEELVNPALTTTVLTSSVNPSSSGQSVTFTATVTSSTGLDSFGSVTFTAGSTALGTVELSGTVAYISTATLPVGSTKITATYSGAKGFTGSSKSLTQKVSP